MYVDARKEDTVLLPESINGSLSAGAPAIFRLGSVRNLEMQTCRSRKNVPNELVFQEVHPSSICSTACY
jgi:hypothetical protein